MHPNALGPEGTNELGEGQDLGTAGPSQSVLMPGPEWGGASESSR